MISNPEPSEKQHELVASTSSFLVFCSVLFLLERLGAPGIALSWALAAAILAITILFAISGRTTSAANFFCANRDQGISGAIIGRLADIMSSPLFLLIIFLQSGNSATVLILISIAVIGHSLNNRFFAKILRKSGAYTIPDFLGYRYGSKLVRFLALIIVLALCASLIFAELRFAGLYLAPILNFSFEYVAAVIVVIAGFAGLMGGIASTSKVQSALILLVLITVILTAIFLAIKLTGIPLPQALLNYTGPIAQNPPLIDIRLARELEFAFGLIENSGIWLPLFILCGYVVFPHLSNRSFQAQSITIAYRGSIRSLVLAALLLTSIPALHYLATANIQPGNPVPQVLQIFIPVAVLMVSISATTLLLTIMANALSHDGYQLLRPGTVPLNRQIFFARIAMILIAYFSWRYIIDPPIDALPLLIWAIGLTVSCLLPVMLFSAFWSGVSRLAIWLGMGVGMIMTIIGFTVLETEYGRGIFQSWLSIDLKTGISPGIVFGLITMITVSTIIFLISWAKRPDAATATKLQDLRNPDKEVLIIANM